MTDFLGLLFVCDSTHYTQLWCLMIGGTAYLLFFFAISHMREQNLIPVLQSLHDRVTTRRKNWSPSSIIVDNAQAELNTLR